MMKNMNTKRILMLLMPVFLMVSALASGKDLERDVTMVSYEQSWLDSEGTLSLKNNTGEDVRRVVFRIVYLDMSDNELDYEDFKMNVDIAPGMTKRVNIPAYEHAHYYNYYLSEGSPVNERPAFKIRFELKDYDGALSGNLLKTLPTGKDVAHPLLLVSAVIGLYFLVLAMAQRRNRNAVAWVLFSIVATPLLAVLILLLIGRSHRYPLEP